MKFVVTLNDVNYNVDLYYLEMAASSSVSALKAQANSAISACSSHYGAQNVGSNNDDPAMQYRDKNDGSLHTLYFPFLRNSENEVRKAFLLAVYHHWEAAVAAWTSQKPDIQSYPELEKEAISLGHEPDPGMNVLCKLANLIKHNSKKARERLKRADSQLYEEIYARSEFEQPWRDYIKISDQRLEWAFGVVKRSGPAGSTLRIPDNATSE